MCQNKIRKKTLAERLKFWILGLFLLILIVLFIVPKVTSHPHIVSAKNLICMRMYSLKQALRMFKLDNVVYPSTKEGLEALVKNPNPKKYSNYEEDGYIKKLPLDSWGNSYRYNYYKTDKGDDFQLISFGADGKYGGEGENEDVVYPTCQK
jgi:general secretion pathway protein G